MALGGGGGDLTTHIAWSSIGGEHVLGGCMGIPLHTLLLGDVGQRLQLDLCQWGVDGQAAALSTCMVSSSTRRKAQWQKVLPSSLPRGRTPHALLPGNLQQHLQLHLRQRRVTRQLRAVRRLYGSNNQQATAGCS